MLVSNCLPGFCSS